MSATDYMENQFAILAAGGVPTVGTGRFACLFTADPTDTGSLTNEISEAGYARQAMAMTAVGSVADNDAQVQFTNNGAQVTASYWGIADAVSGGNLLFKGPLTTPRVWASGTLTAAAADFSVAVD